MRLKEFDTEKELKKLERKRYKKPILIISGLVFMLVAIYLYRTYAIFQVSSSFNFINAEVGSFTTGNIKTIIDGNIYIEWDVNMIPIAYENGVTVKADIASKNSNYSWFNYCQRTNSEAGDYNPTCEFRWANIVLVEANGVNSRETYKNAIPGTPINEADILAYYVYVPRYKYEIFNNANPIVGVSEQIINVEFENRTIAKSSGVAEGTWLTHPAFTFGTTELNGIWIGKFEISSEENSTCYSASSVANCNQTSISPRIKPNKNSWRYANLSTMYIVSQYFKSNPMYGINAPTIDSHMIKNMEWASALYLSQSIYGKRGLTTAEIYANNYNAGSSAYYNTLTGCCAANAGAAQSTTCSRPFPINTGLHASTSGSLYGIYDMRGGAHEYTMGNMVNIGGAFQTSSSGFNGSSRPYPDPKYYDSYEYGTTASDIDAYSRGLLGDGTRESIKSVGGVSCGWYNGTCYFVRNAIAWFTRGGTASGGALHTAYSYDSGVGGTSSEITTRSVLVVE